MRAWEALCDPEGSGVAMVDTEGLVVSGPGGEPGISIGKGSVSVLASDQVEMVVEWDRLGDMMTAYQGSATESMLGIRQGSKWGIVSNQLLYLFLHLLVMSLLLPLLLSLLLPLLLSLLLPLLPILLTSGSKCGVSK